jgi:hypothetical protein
MSKPPQVRRSPATLSLKLGQWFEANATGWGVLAVPVVILLLGAAALVQVLAA